MQNSTEMPQRPAPASLFTRLSDALTTLFKRSSAPAEEARIFRRAFCERSRRTMVFEDDGQSGWLYLSVPGRLDPAAAVWVYNRGETPDAFTGYSDSDDRAPRAPASHMLPGGGLAADDDDEFANSEFVARWANDGCSVALLINGEPRAFIENAEEGYSKWLSRSGEWGHPWVEERYQALFIEKDR